MSVLFVSSEDSAEPRVAATPATVERYVKAGFDVVVAAGAGASSMFADEAYAEAGARIADDPAAARAEADLVIQVGIPTVEQVRQSKQGAALVSFLWAPEHLDVVEALVERRIAAFAMDAIPRISRAQKDDALSSQANIAGYKAVLLALEHLPRVLPLMTTAAGTIRPGKVVVIGGGVAGLQAVATARRLGGVVWVSDVRPEVEEQVKSLGANWIDVEGADFAGEGGYAKEQTEEFKRKQQEALEGHLASSDVVICTALIPYRPAPKIVSEAIVQKMRRGSVIVDLAAERGGNCECTVPDEVVERHGVTIVGTLNVPGLVPVHASEMYANNVRNVVLDMTTDGEFAWDRDDEIVAGALVTYDGEVVHERVRAARPGDAVEEDTADADTVEEDAVEEDAVEEDTP